MSAEIAIDGPAGAGKTTVARLLAQRLQYLLVESGRWYRLVAWRALQEDLREPEALCRVVQEIALKNGIPSLPGATDQDLYGPAVSRKAAEIASLAALRDVINARLRELARQHPVVAEGRDMGTVVFPDAQLKIYLTASPEVRVARVLAMLRGRGVPLSHEEAEELVEARTRRDRERAVAPLRKAEDAHVVDTTHLSPEEVVQRILELYARTKRASAA